VKRLDAIVETMRRDGWLGEFNARYKPEARQLWQRGTAS